MYYVIKKGEKDINISEAYASLPQAKTRASYKKATYKENYDIVEMSTVWTTQTLEEAMKEERNGRA